MSDEFNEEEIEAGADDLRRASMILLERQFVHDDDYGMGTVYRLLIENKAHCETVFDSLGLDLVSRPDEGFIGVLPRGLTRRRLSGDESVFGVALRMAYERRVEARDIDKRGRASVLVSDVWDIAEATRQGRQRPMALGASRDIVAAYSGRGILSIIEEVDGGDAAIEIRPCIRDAIPDMVLRRLAVEAGQIAMETTGSASEETSEGAAR